MVSLTECNFSHIFSADNTSLSICLCLNSQKFQTSSAMASTKVSSVCIMFPWLKAEELVNFPKQLQVNWRKKQRLVAPGEEEGEPKWNLFADWLEQAFWLDYSYLQYLASITDAISREQPMKALLEMQGYGGGIHTEVIDLYCLYWCGTPGKSHVRFDYLNHAGEPKQYWGGLVLAIAPVRADTPLQCFEIETKVAPTDDQKHFMRLLEQYGLPKN